jgi:hypothetical protein
MPMSEEHKKKRGRNWAVAGVLVFMVILFYGASIEKMRETGIVTG